MVNRSSIVQLIEKFVTLQPIHIWVDPGPTTFSHTTDISFNVWKNLGCSLFARRYSENAILFIFLGVLRCFNSPGIASRCYLFTSGYQPLRLVGSPIQDPASQSLFAAHRRLSQLTTPFIAILCQGIHYTPLVA